MDCIDFYRFQKSRNLGPRYHFTQAFLPIKMTPRLLQAGKRSLNFSNTTRRYINIQAILCSHVKKNCSFFSIFFFLLRVPNHPRCEKRHRAVTINIQRIFIYYAVVRSCTKLGDFNDHYDARIARPELLIAYPAVLSVRISIPMCFYIQE